MQSETYTFGKDRCSHKIECQGKEDQVLLLRPCDLWAKVRRNLTREQLVAAMQLVLRDLASPVQDVEATRDHGATGHFHVCKQ